MADLDVEFFDSDNHLCQAKDAVHPPFSPAR
jgi:hypothetical protein